MMKLKATALQLKSNEYAFELDDHWSTVDRLHLMNWAKDSGFLGKVYFSEIDVSMFADEFLVPIVVIPNDKKLLTLFSLKWL